jgi:Lrp/AsnC family transcriptional regulator
MAAAELDRIDREILRLLMRDASRSLAEIAQEVGLTPTPCWKRIRRMEEQGVITGRVALVDADRVGLPISVFVSIETGDHSADWIARFAAAVESMPEIVECWRLGGDVDYLLRVVVSDMAPQGHRPFRHGAGEGDHRPPDLSAVKVPQSRHDR